MEAILEDLPHIHLYLRCVILQIHEQYFRQPIQMPNNYSRTGLDDLVYCRAGNESDPGDGVLHHVDEGGEHRTQRLLNLLLVSTGHSSTQGSHSGMNVKPLRCLVVQLFEREVRDVLPNAEALDARHAAQQVCCFHAHCPGLVVDGLTDLLAVFFVQFALLYATEN